MDDKKTTIYEGRPINRDDLESQVKSLTERSKSDPNHSDDYLREATKLDNFRRSLDDD